MHFNFTKKQLFTLVMACTFLALQPLTAQVFWSEDFSGGGLPANWVAEDITSNAGEEVIFTHSTDPAAVEVAALGNTATSEFLSTDAANGYLWANADRGLAAAPLVNHTAQLTTDVIDCSGQSIVFLKFESLIGVYDFDAETNAIVRVSTDNATWTNYTVFPGLTTAVRWSANPQESIIDISDTAAGESTVYIQYQWIGGWDYFWALDNITLTNENPAPPTDLQVNSPLGPFYAIAPNAITPASQVEPIGFFADIANIGSADQNNVSLNISIFDETNLNTAVYTEDFAYNTVPAAGIIENQLMPGTYTPAATAASYLGRYTISSDDTANDSNPDNNVQDFNFAISEDLFSKDFGNFFFTRPADASWTGDEPHSWVYGNFYHVVNGAGFYADHAEFVVNGVSGQSLTVWLYKWEDTNGDGQANEDERTRVAFNLYDVTGNEGNEIVSLPLVNFADNSPVVPLEDNTDYLLMLDYTSPDATTDLELGFSDQFDYQGMNYRSDSLGMARYNSFLGIGAEVDYGSTAFGWDFSPVARFAITNTPVGVDVLTDNNVFEVFPNPAKNIINVNLDLENTASTLNVQIMDVQGRLLLNQQYSNVQQEQMNFDVTDWTSGTYFVRLLTEEGIKTKRFVIQK